LGNMRVELIITGGTFSQVRDEATGVLRTPRTREEVDYVKRRVLDVLRERGLLSNVDVYPHIPYVIDSTDLEPAHIYTLYSHIVSSSADGFVIIHGTDTLAYTAAALSFLLPLGVLKSKSIAITGSMKPLQDPDTDAVKNLVDAFVSVVSGVKGLHVVFNGKIIAGTRASKVRVKTVRGKTADTEVDAFDSVNAEPLGRIEGDKVVLNRDLYEEYLESLLPTDGLRPELNTGIAVLKFFPGMSGEVIEVLAQRFSGLVLESYGLGGVPKYLFEAVRKSAELGRRILVLTQVAYPYTDLGEYEVGARLRGLLNIYEAGDMTREAAIMKFAWALAQEDPDAVMKRCYRFECRAAR